MNREIGKVHCSCGGSVEEVDTYDQEEKRYGCHTRGCCVRAYQCKNCKTRFTFALNAPDYD